jgi:hypothetical protein
METAPLTDCAEEMGPPICRGPLDETGGTRAIAMEEA